MNRKEQIRQAAGRHGWRDGISNVWVFGEKFHGETTAYRDVEMHPKQDEEEGAIQYAYSLYVRGLLVGKVYGTSNKAEPGEPVTRWEASMDPEYHHEQSVFGDTLAELYYEICCLFHIESWKDGEVGDGEEQAA